MACCSARLRLEVCRGVCLSPADTDAASEKAGGHAGPGDTPVNMCVGVGRRGEAEGEGRREGGRLSRLQPSGVAECGTSPIASRHNCPLLTTAALPLFYVFVTAPLLAPCIAVSDGCCCCSPAPDDHNQCLPLPGCTVGSSAPAGSSLPEPQHQTT